MRVIDNQHTFLKDDLAQTIKPHARLSIAAARERSVCGSDFEVKLRNKLTMQGVN